MGEIMGWFAFFTVLVILLVYRSMEGKRDDARNLSVSFARARINELEANVRVALAERDVAIAERYETERGAVVIRQSCKKNEAALQWEIPFDRLSGNDKHGSGKRLLEGPCSGED